MSMTYTIDELFTAAEQEIAAWKSEGDKPRTDNDYMYLGFLRAVANRLPRVSQNSGKPLVSGSLPQREVQKLINGFCELQAAGLWEAFKAENKTMLNELLILISGNDR